MSQDLDPLDPAAIVDRVRLLEDEMRVVQRDVSELKGVLAVNTSMTSDIHGKNHEMYEAFSYGKNGIKVITTIGNGVMWVADRSGKLGKGFGGLALIMGGVWGAATGKIPAWVEWLMKIIA